jgi:hypothetical protein
MAAHGGAGALAAAMGNQAFGTQYGGGAVGIAPGTLANAGSVLARALFSDPSTAVRAPWASLRSEAEQSRANLVGLRPRDALGVDRTPDREVGAGLASAVLARQTLARQDHPPGGGTEQVPPAPKWEQFFTGDALSGIRAGLEITRVWPGVGAWTGLASDVAGTVSDIATINQEEAPIIKTVIGIRGILNAVNNFVGHISYLGQVASKAAGISVVAAWLMPIIDAVNLGIKDLKLLLDVALGLIDVGLWAAAEQQKQHATTPASAGRWNTMIGNYQANMIGDLATLMVDGYDAATATEGGGEAAKQTVYSLRGLMQAMRKWGPTLVSWFLGLFNVYGSKVTTPSAPGEAPAPATPPPTAGGPAPTPTSATPPSATPAPPPLARAFAPSVSRLLGGPGMEAMGRQALSMAIVAELQQVKVGYQVADAALSAGGDMLSMLVQQQRDQLTALLGGRDPFEFVRDAGVSMTRMLADKAASLEQASVLSSSATERAAQLRSTCDSVLGFLDSINVPQVDIPGLGFIVDEVRGAVDEAKSMGRGPVETVKKHADEVAEFLTIFADIARQQVATVRKHIEDISQGLAKCNGFEDVFNLMLRKIQEVLGIGTNLTIQDVRDYWNGIGGQIDAAIVWAQGLAEDNPPEPPSVTGPAADTPPGEPAAVQGAQAAAAGATGPGQPMAAPASASSGAAGGAAAPGAAAAEAAVNTGAPAGGSSGGSAAPAAANGAAGGAAGAGAAGAASANGAAAGAAGAAGGAYDGGAGAAGGAGGAAANGAAAGAGGGAAGGSYDGGAGAAGGGAAGAATSNGGGGAAGGAAGGESIEQRLAAAAAARAGGG